MAHPWGTPLHEPSTNPTPLSSGTPIKAAGITPKSACVAHSWSGVWRWVDVALAQMVLNPQRGFFRLWRLFWRTLGKSLSPKPHGGAGGLDQVSVRHSGIPPSHTATA
uniref:Uncharacterized protein n=1 Tax=Knipowitschia caucasica TaxID=637954 RepID=A0AAV2MMR7_KNICA